MPRRTVALTLAFSLAAAGPSFAQVAGDDQYTDPFADEEPAPAQTAPAEPSTPSLSQSPPSAVPSATPSASTPAPTAAAPAPAATAAPQLPATGAEPVITLLFGGALVLAGAGLRLRFGQQ